MISPAHIAFSDEILRSLADRMVALRLGALPVVDRADERRVVGLISQFHLLAAREKLLVKERHAERVLGRRPHTV